MTDYYTAGFAVRDPSWHRREDLLKVPPKTVKEAIQRSYAAWTVRNGEVWVRRWDAPDFVDLAARARMGDMDAVSALIDSFVPHSEMKSLWRDDTGELITLANSTWKQLQNEDAFNFFDVWISSGAASFEAAGTLKGNEKLFVLCKINLPSAEVVPGDEVAPYVALTNSHVPGTATGVLFTCIRIVCWNTEQWAVSVADRKKMIRRVRHNSPDPQKELADIQASMDLASRTFEDTTENYRRMAAAPFNEGAFEAYARAVFSVPDDKPSRDWQHWEGLLSLYRRGAGTQIEGVRDTVWGSYNAITEYLTHDRMARTRENRLDSLWFGDSKSKSDRAYEIASEVAATN